MKKAKGIGTSILVVLAIAVPVWFGRDWLEQQAAAWPSIRFTLQAIVPVLAAATWWALDQDVITSRAVRWVLNVVIIGALLWWFNNLVIPANYVWTDAVPVIIGVIAFLGAGVTLLGWAKPYLAGLKWWEELRQP